MVIIRKYQEPELEANQKPRTRKCFTWFECVEEHNLHPREKPTDQALLMIQAIFTP